MLCPRLMLRLQAALVLVVLLAACQSRPPASPTPPEPTRSGAVLPAPSSYPPPATQAPSPAAPSLTPALAPSAANPAGAGVADPRLLLGIQSPLSGAQSIVGAGLRNGAGLATLQIARPLIDLGFSLDLRALDDQDKPKLAAANAATLVEDSDVLCVVGHLDSAATLAALPVYQRAALAVVVPASAGVGITGGRDNLLRLIGRDDVQAIVGARFARERLKAQRAYIVEEPSDYGEVLASAFRTRAQADGLAVVGVSLLGEESPLDAVRAAKPDVIYLAARFPLAGPFIGQLRSAGIGTALVGPDGLDSPELLRLAGAPIQDLYFTTLTAPVAQMPFAAQFAADYEARFASIPPPFAAHAYDAASICIEAISRAAEAAGGRPSRIQVRDALHRLSTYEGIASSYRFAPSGELVEAPYYIVQASPVAWSANSIIAEVGAPPP